MGLSYSNRTTDMKAEKVLGVFLDRYFYSWLARENSGLKCKRQYNVTSQLNGVDVIIQKGEKVLKVDEKAAIYHSNTMIPTFAFEVNSIQNDNGYPILGWFLNDNLQTNYYLIIWTNVKCELNKEIGLWVRKELTELKSTDFSIIEAYLIRKSVLRAFLARDGWNKAAILRRAELIRKTKCSQKIDVGHKEFYFYYSEHLAEKPINIVIKKSTLYKLSDRAYLISQTGVAELKNKANIH